MQTILTFSAVSLLLAALLLLAYIRSGRKDAWRRNLSACAAALSGLLLLAFLGFFPRVAAQRGCTAYVLQGGVMSVERTCKT